MTSKRTAQSVARPRGDDGYWIDHAELVEDDLAWLREARRLTLWNVRMPKGFLAQLPALVILDVRGGSATNLEVIDGTHLRCLVVNQLRGLTDLSAIAAQSRLRVLSLYGLARVTVLPPLDGLSVLERLELGQMRSLTSLTPGLRAPALKELYLVRDVPVSPEDVVAINSHPSLQAFSWFAEDVPDRVWAPVVNQVSLPEADVMRAEEWYELHGDA